MTKSFTTLCLIFLLALPAALPAHAEDYAKPNWTNLLRTLIRFNAIDITDDKTLDEYAAVSECDLYKTIYRDDFKWNQVRAAMRESIRLNLTEFPTSYGYVTPLQLDRYDFKGNLFHLTPKSTLKNVNTFRIFKIEAQPCDQSPITLIPSSFRVVLDMPLYFDGIPLMPNDAQALLKQMKDDNNTDRIIYAKFNIRIVYVEPMHLAQALDGEHGYQQSHNSEDHAVRLDARLDSIDFFEDETLTKLIYKLQP